MSVHSEIKKVTTETLRKMKFDKEKITMLTAYDFTTAKMVDAGGVDTILRQRFEGAAGDQRSDLRRPAMPKLFREWKRGQPGRGAGRGHCLSRDAAPGVLRDFGEQSGTQEQLPQEGPQSIRRLGPRAGRIGRKRSRSLGVVLQ
jgi:hypothetical protein